MIYLGFAAGILGFAARSYQTVLLINQISRPMVCVLCLERHTQCCSRTLNLGMVAEEICGLMSSEGAQLVLAERAGLFFCSGRACFFCPVVFFCPVGLVFFVRSGLLFLS